MAGLFNVARNKLLLIDVLSSLVYSGMESSRASRDGRGMY